MCLQEWFRGGRSDGGAGDTYDFVGHSAAKTAFRATALDLKRPTGSEAAAVPNICRSNMNFCKIHCLNTFDSLAQKCQCVRTLQSCG